jgi:hypothetical protein
LIWVQTGSMSDPLRPTHAMRWRMGSGIPILRIGR